MDGKCKDCKFSREFTNEEAEEFKLIDYAQNAVVMCFRYPPQWMGGSGRCLPAVPHKESTCGEFKPREYNHAN